MDEVKRRTRRSVKRAISRIDQFNKASKVDLRFMLGATIWLENLSAFQFDILRRSISLSATNCQQTSICTSLRELREIVRFIGPVQVILRAVGSEEDGLQITVIRQGRDG